MVVRQNTLNKLSKAQSPSRSFIYPAKVVNLYHHQVLPNNNFTGITSLSYWLFSLRKIFLPGFLMETSKKELNLLCQLSECFWKPKIEGSVYYEYILPRLLSDLQISQTSLHGHAWLWRQRRTQAAGIPAICTDKKGILAVSLLDSNKRCPLYFFFFLIFIRLYS